MTKIALAVGVAALTCFSAGAMAANVKLSKADCQGIWSKADAAQANSLSMTQAQPYVTNFKAVDTNADSKISGEEFLAGCEKGLAHDSASTGASSGSSGSSAPAKSPDSPAPAKSPDKY